MKISNELNPNNNKVSKNSIILNGKNLNIKNCSVDLSEVKKDYIKSCSVKLNPIKTCYIKLKSIDEHCGSYKMETPTVKRRPGRKPKNASASATSTPVASKDTLSDADTEATATTPAADTPAAASKKQAGNKKTPVQAIVAENVGRGKRTPKPNPRYMNDTIVNTTKIAIKEDSADSMGSMGEGDELLSSDEYQGQADATGKKRKSSPKSLPVKITSLKKTPSSLSKAGKKGSASVPVKRKYAEIDIDIDDERGKQLFLAAKRRLTHSPLNSDDDLDTRRAAKGKLDGKPDALAAKLLAKFGDVASIKKNSVKTTVNKLNNTTRVLKTSDKDKQNANNKSLTKDDEDLEDFEQMPTFTIVNINDIMDQKGIVKRKQGGGKAADAETVEDEDGRKQSLSDTEMPYKGVGGASNRRKTQHTKILSDDKIIKTEKKPAPTPPNAIIKAKSQLVTKTFPLKTPAPKTFPTATQLAKINNNGRFRDGMSNKPAILRPPPPRILNSTLCKPSNQKTVPSLVTKLVTKNNTKDKQNNNTILARSKENNVTSYTYTEKDGKLIPKKIPAPPKPSLTPIVRSATTLSATQRVISPGIGQKFVKKITCFETWHVIKMPEEKPKSELSKTTISLLELHENIKNITLPSEHWESNVVVDKPSTRGFGFIKKKPVEEFVKKKEEEKPDVTKESTVKDEKERSNADSDADASSSTESTIDKNATGARTRSSTAATASPSTAATTTTSTTASTSKAGSKAAEKAESKDSKEDSSTTGTPGKTEAGNESSSTEKTDEVQDEQPISKPSLIMFRRKCIIPKARMQFDRSIIFKDKTYLINIDNRNVKLLAAPAELNSFEDIEILLQIVNDVSLKSTCIELTTQSL